MKLLNNYSGIILDCLLIGCNFILLITCLDLIGNVSLFKTIVDFGLDGSFILFIIFLGLEGNSILFNKSLAFGLDNLINPYFDVSVLI